MIGSFRSKETKALWDGQFVGRFASIRKTALRKLDMIDSAEGLMDLRSPPGNRLEALKGDRQGQQGIRINDRFRICFAWREGAAHDIEIVDYY